MFQKVKLHKFIKRYLPIFLFVFVFVFSVPFNVQASEDVNLGIPEAWDGIVNIDLKGMNVDLNLYDTITYSPSTGNPTSAKAVYKGSQNVNITIQNSSESVGKYLNGYIKKRIKVKFTPLANMTYYTPSVTCNPIVLDSIYANVSYVSQSDGEATYDVYVRFNNYYLSDDILNFPLKLDFSIAAHYYFTGGNYNVMSTAYGAFSVVEDYSGSLWQYEVLDDVPSIDGYFAEQNTEIINQSTINNQLIEQQIQQDHEDTLQQTDTLTNGYDNSAGNAAADRLDDTTSDLNNAENSLFGTVSGANEDYTDITDFFTNLKVIESFSFIKSIMESIYASMGDFAMPITIAFMFIIVTRLIGYQMFTSGGG